MPFGLCNSPERFMEAVLAGLVPEQCTDYILVMGRTLAEFEGSATSISASEVTVETEKSCLAREQWNYLVSRKGIIADPKEDVSSPHRFGSSFLG